MKKCKVPYCNKEAGYAIKIKSDSYVDLCLEHFVKVNEKE